MRVADFVMTHFANLAIWAGKDSFRWKMKNLGWSGWGTKSVTEPEPEVGFEKEE